MKIIYKMSIENNLSNSKVISILVEEALSTRGLFNKKNGKASNSYIDIKDNLPVINGDSADFIDNVKFSIDAKLGNHFNPSESSYLKEANQDAFDLQTYKKFLSFVKFQEMMDKYKT